LDENCNLKEMAKSDPEVVTKIIKKKFAEKCEKKNSCDLDLIAKDWPDKCKKMITGSKLKQFFAYIVV